MKRLIIAISLTLTSCLDPFNFTDSDHWDVCQEAKIHVEQFYKEAAKRGIHLQHENLLISLKHQENNPDNWGMTWSTTPPIITLDYNYVKGFDISAKDSVGFLMIQYLVFHELGHALLGRSHTNTFTIMNPTNLHAEYYNLEKRTKLIDELFKSAPQ